MKDKISVIIPIYNMEKYLKRALDSILRQSYKNLEIILVDDGSTDDSREICLSYVQNDKRFCYYYQENKGVAAARNLGLEKSSGDFIAFLDPDDYIDSNMYECLLRAIKENGADIAVCGYRIVRDGEEEYDSITEYRADILDKKAAQERYFLGSHEATEMSVVWNKLIPTAFIHNLKFPIGRIQEDESITYKLLYMADSIAYIDAPYYNYYVHFDGLMNQKFNKSRFDLFQAYLERMDFYIEHGEYELCGRVLMLYMHMICFYRELMKQSDEDLRSVHKFYLREWRREYKKYQPKMKLCRKMRAECELFNTAPSFYHMIWRILKKHG